MLWLSLLLPVLAAIVYWLLLELTARGQCPLVKPATVPVYLFLAIGVGVVTGVRARLLGKSGIATLGHIILSALLTIGMCSYLIVVFADGQECFA